MKAYNDKRFVLRIEDQPIVFNCETTKTRQGFCHHCYTWGSGKYGEHSRKSYINRTYEAFRYESVILHAIKKFPKAMQPALRAEVQKIADEKLAECNAFLQDLRSNFDSLSDEQKKVVRENTPHIETASQAHFVGAAVAMLAAAGK